MKFNTNELIIGVDPGNLQSGVCMIGGGKVLYASNLANAAVFGQLKELAAGGKIVAVIEDMMPYALRLTPQVIDACKFIGELCWRLSGADFVGSINLVARNSVKKWIFDSFTETVVPRIKKRMAAANLRMVSKGQKGLIRVDGEMRDASFHYVDDGSVIAALKVLYEIPTPKPGKLNIYGLKEHSWQALSVAAYYENKKNICAQTEYSDTRRAPGHAAKGKGSDVL